MKAVRIKANEIKAQTIEDIQKELEMHFANEIQLLCNAKNLGKSDAIEAVAQHISVVDTDFVFITL
jgi:UDP-N-acetyl-D-mannosaminuronate dehydrogenase